MPKEIAHLILAQKVSQQMPATSIFHGPVHRCFNLFQYGAVAPDTCFYYLFGPYASTVQKACQVFHSTDSSALQPVLGLLNHRPEPADDVLAFAAGLCCHILTDTVFHPMVYYFSGMDDLHEGATARHRLFETALDTCFASRHSAKKPVRLYPVVQSVEVSQDRLAWLLRKVLCPEPMLWERYLLRAIKYHQAAHWLFCNRIACRAVHFPAPTFMGLPPVYRNLFYPVPTPVFLPLFSHGIHFQDPETGKISSERISGMIDKVVSQTLLLLGRIEDGFLSDRDAGAFLADPGLPDIRPCLSPRASDFKHWHGVSDLHTILYGGGRG